MLLWSGACVVHEEFKSQALFDLKALYPDAGVLVRPESPAAVIDIADAVGSTSQILKSASELPHQTFIEAPTAGDGATCRSCAHCPWMAMNELSQLARELEEVNLWQDNEVRVDPQIGAGAMVPLNRMLDFKR